MLSKLKYRIKEVIIGALELDIDPDEISDHDIILGEGLSENSLIMIEIIVALEGEFGIRVDDEDIRGEFFKSVESIARYITDKVNCPTQ